MSKIVFFCIPAHGHTNPTLGVVRELISRGHQVYYYSYNMMRDKIQSTGAVFVSCDEYDQEQRLDAKDGARIGKDLAFSTQILVDTTLALDDTVCEHMKELNPDCIIADSMAVWGKAVALKLGIPFVSSTTTFAFNQYSAKIMKQSPGQIFGMIFSMSKINKNIKRLQDKGYPVKSVLDIIQNDNNTDTIVYTSPEFQPCSETFSKKYVFVGPSIRPVENMIEKKADKLIYISMGTVINDSTEFYKKCIEALANTKYQVIMSVGNLINIEDLGAVPDNITISRFVDQIAVLSQADVFLTGNSVKIFFLGLFSFVIATMCGVGFAKIQSFFFNSLIKSWFPSFTQTSIDLLSFQSFSKLSEYSSYLLLSLNLSFISP